MQNLCPWFRTRRFLSKYQCCSKSDRTRSVYRCSVVARACLSTYVDKRLRSFVAFMVRKKCTVLLTRNCGPLCSASCGNNATRPSWISKKEMSYLLCFFFAYSCSFKTSRRWNIFEAMLRPCTVPQLMPDEINFRLNSFIRTRIVRTKYYTKLDKRSFTL